MIDINSVVSKLNEFLPSLPVPTINYPCEINCPFSNSCEYLGCYYNGVINLRSEADERVLVHEYGHYIYHSAVGRGRLEESERFAQWFEKSFYNPVSCDLCGNNLIYNDEFAICPNCRSFYSREYYSSDSSIVVKSIIIGSIVTLITAFITNTLPMPEDPTRVKIEKTSKILASAIVGSFASLVALLI